MFTARCLILFAVLLSPLVSLATNNLPASPPYPDTVFLKQDCTGTQNCATTMSELLSWTYTTRQPTASSPLLIDIGPGTFGGFTCGPIAPTTTDGYLTLRGAGRHNTQIGPTTINGCNQIGIQNLSIVNTNGDAITWGYGGSATFSDIEVTAVLGKAWMDYAPTNGHGPIVYWWNSVLNATGTQPVFQTDGGVHRCYGSEFNLTASGDNLYGAVHLLHGLGQSGEIQLYGSAIRVNAQPGANVSNLLGVLAKIGRKFHLHGGSIGVNASSSGNANANVMGIQGTAYPDSGAASTIHVLETAFALTAKGTGTTKRLFGVPAGKGMESPFLWSNGPNAPPLTSSQNGADMYVETDCSALKCSSSSAADGTETHLMIYNNSCATDGPWFDVVTSRCRGL